jgi:hypothetical protein
MDGLLANLFDFIGQKIYGKEYKDVTPEEKQKARNIWKDKKEFYKQLGGTYEVFANLPPYSTNDILIKKVIEKFGSFSICTHPSPIETQDCIKGKQEWIDKHIKPKFGKFLDDVYFPEKKSIYAVSQDGTPNVLIDDFIPYIDAWNSKGGIAIKLQSSLFNSSSISQYLDTEFAKINIQESFKNYFNRTK